MTNEERTEAAQSNLERAVEAEMLRMAVDGVENGKDHVFAAGGWEGGEFQGGVQRVTRKRGEELAKQAAEMGLSCMLGEPLGASVAAREVTR